LGVGVARWGTAVPHGSAPNPPPQGGREKHAASLRPNLASVIENLMRVEAGSLSDRARDQTGGRRATQRGQR
jgi:hypothetical protein